jgi:hypothetical protein
MSAQPPEIIIEDFDTRCEKHFPDTDERCWCLAVKVIKFRGHTENVCLAHYEEWLRSLAEMNQRR